MLTDDGYKQSSRRIKKEIIRDRKSYKKNST